MGDWDALFSLAEGKGSNDISNRNTNNSASFQDAITEETDKINHTSHQPKSSHKRKRKRKNVPSAAASDSNSNSANSSLHDKAFAAMLESRWKVVPNNNDSNTRHEDSSISSWPDWLELGESLLELEEESSSHNKTACPCWKESTQQQQHSSSSSSSCEYCQRSPLYHKVRVKFKTSSKSSSSKSTVAPDNDWPLDMFCHLRNIRCCAKYIVLCKIQGKARKQVLSTLEKCMKFFQRHRLTIALHSIPKTEEASLLESKIGRVRHYSTKILQYQQGHNSNDNTPNHSTRGTTPTNVLFDNSVRLIMACDAVYYRLYYLQITKQLPAMMATMRDCTTDSNEKVRHVFLPHPIEYFGLPNLTSNDTAEFAILNQFVDELKKSESNSNSKPPINKTKSDHDNEVGDILQQYGFCIEESSGIVATGNEQVAEKHYDHPLSMLHRFRFLETLSIFYHSGWWSKSETQNETIRSLTRTKPRQQQENDDGDDGDEEEETPAPFLLMEWRDSCRDFLCNLYAYATFSPSNLLSIREFVDRNEIHDGILEYGAGTGYIAKVLATKANVTVSAYDVVPTTTTSATSIALKTETAVINEYHGQTPSFLAVQRGDRDTFRKDLEHSLLPKNFALMLCYPPPGSSMAHDILKELMHHGGQFVIHIGEFRGLTGSADFEQLLLNNFQCQGRHPCLSWGTDASEVSMWKRRNQSLATTTRYSSPSINDILLPCSFCREREASFKCRLLRYVVYCSESCCRNDSISRSNHLKMNMIQLKDSDQLDYHNGQHFATLY